MDVSNHVSVKDKRNEITRPGKKPVWQADVEYVCMYTRKVKRERGAELDHHTKCMWTLRVRKRHKVEKLFHLPCQPSSSSTRKNVVVQGMFGFVIVDDTMRKGKKRKLAK
jgi:hypothetical protein